MGIEKKRGGKKINHYVPRLVFLPSEGWSGYEKKGLSLCLTKTITPLEPTNRYLKRMDKDDTGVRARIVLLPLFLLFSPTASSGKGNRQGPG